MQALTEGLLKVDPGLFLWTLITFGLLMLILWKAAWKPIVKALDSRAERIRTDLENAEKAKVDAEKILAEHKALMAKSREESDRIVSTGKDEAIKLKSEILERANSEAKEIVEKAKREINTAKDKALADIKSEVVVLSTDIASKIIGKNLKYEDQKSLVEETLNKMRTVQ